MIKSKVKIVKSTFVVLVIIIPLIKLFMDLIFDITLRNDAKIILTYFYTYFILVIISILLVRKNSFSLVTIIFALIYGIALFIGNGLDDGLNSLKEFHSPNNKNTLLINVERTWHPGATVSLYTEVGPFLKKSIKIPKMDSKFDNHNYIELRRIEWKDDNTLVISGDIAKNNIWKFKNTKKALKDKCDYEILDDEIYLNIP